MAPSQATDRVIGSRYRLSSRLGRGGMGVVWAAEDLLLGRRVAIKEVEFPPSISEEECAALRARVMREARTAARLNHPVAVTVYDVVDEGGPPFLVMELVESPTLHEVVAQRGPLTPPQAANAGEQLLDALTAAHAAGIVHRDVKPANVMLSENGRLRLADFGIASLKGDPSITSTGMVLGSPSYMAPEQARTGSGGPAADLWSLGATLYYAVEGRPPFDNGDPLPTLAAVLHEEPTPPRNAGPLAPVLAALLRKSPEERPDAERLAAMLADVRRTAEPPQATLSLSAADLTGIVAERAAAPVDEASATLADRRPSPPAAPSPAREPAPPRPPRPRPSSVPPPAGRRRSVAVLLALAAVAAGAVALLLSGSDDRPSPTREASPRRSSAPQASPAARATSGAPAPAAQPTDGAARATAPPASAVPAPVPVAGDRPAGVPSDWTRYTDSTTGFRMYHPPGWSVRRDGVSTFFREPGSGTYLQVAYTTDPGPSPEGKWYENEPGFRRSHTGYRRIQITPTTYQGYDAAIWEFTYTSGGARLHAANLGFLPPGYGFALYFQTAEGAWAGSQSLFQTFQKAFRAPR